MESFFLNFADALIDSGFELVGVSDEEGEEYPAATPLEALSLCRDVESATVHFARLPERVDVFVIPELGDEDVADYSCTRGASAEVDATFNRILEAQE